MASLNLRPLRSKLVFLNYPFVVLDYFKIIRYIWTLSSTVMLAAYTCMYMCQQVAARSELKGNPFC